MLKSSAETKATEEALVGLMVKFIFELRQLGEKYPSINLTGDP